MENVIDLNSRRPKVSYPWFNFFCVCLACKYKWIATAEVRTNVFKFQCPKCKEQDSFAAPWPDGYSKAVKDLK